MNIDNHGKITCFTKQYDGPFHSFVCVLTKSLLQKQMLILPKDSNYIHVLLLLCFQAS